MPTVTIDDRTFEVAAGTNLIDAGLQVGVHVPHYCYHPRLSVVGQCRMCLVEIEGQPKLQAACVTRVEKDGMVVRTTSEKVREAQNGMMEFFLVNHPLDCPICDQAGECGLQDYSFKHGQAFSRYRYEDKRTYPGRERIPLGPNVLLNMNRCIQCTRCIRFTQEVSKTSELAFFNRGGRVEIGIFPGKELDNELATNVVDICPVGALTSTRFRFAERVWYLDKKPSLCTGCDVGCNITLEHRRGKIRRYKPRFNPEVNDYWMCDHGRGSFERYEELPRLLAPRLRQGEERPRAVDWKTALDHLETALQAAEPAAVAVLGSAALSTEEAYLLARLAAQLGTPHRALAVAPGPARFIPNPQGGITGTDGAPNRRGAELAGLRPEEGGLDADELLHGDGAARCQVLVVADSDLGPAAHDPRVVERLRRACNLVVLGWADTPLAQAADLALPLATHAEKDGTFINAAHRLQAFTRCFPAPGQARPAVEVLAELLGRWEERYRERRSASQVFAAMAEEVPALHGLTLDQLPARGIDLAAPAPGSGREAVAVTT
jgi:NADH-quinone oxidoreductase subunit G